jgi:hypothetical protein
MVMGYPENDLEGPAFLAAFREALQKLGWAEDRNIRFDTRWATPEDAEARQRFAKELVALEPDLILSAVTPTTTALLQQTRPHRFRDPLPRSGNGHDDPDAGTEFDDRGGLQFPRNRQRPARRRQLQIRSKRNMGQ